MSLNLKDYIYLDIPEGRVKQIARKSDGLVLWKQGYTNQVPKSTDTDGSIYNGTGYKDNVRLSSSGGVSGSAQSGSTTTGFIPFYGDTTIIRMKGVQWRDVTSGHHYINFYDSAKKFKTYISASMVQSGDYSHIITVTRDANGVETFDINESYGTSNSVLQLIRQSSYVRITAKGSGADMVVTINEEIN